MSKNVISIKPLKINLKTIFKEYFRKFKATPKQEMCNGRSAANPSVTENFEKPPLSYEPGTPFGKF